MGIAGGKALTCQMCPRLGSECPPLLLTVALLPSKHFYRAIAMCSGEAVLGKDLHVLQNPWSAKDRLAVILRGRLVRGEQI